MIKKKRRSQRRGTKSGICKKRRFGKVIMQQHSPRFFAFYPDPSIHEHAHQASFDSLMLVNVMSALIEPTHRDKLRAEECGTGELRTDKQISRLQEQLEMKKPIDRNVYVRDQMWHPKGIIDPQSRPMS